MGKFVSIPISIKSDDEGLIGRQCPNKDCEGYFKVQFGTGLKRDNLPCNCPYCGHQDGQSSFFTEDQVKHIRSHAMRYIQGEVGKIFKTVERRPKPGALFDVSITFKEGRPYPIHYYREKQLEQEVVCDGCTLRYAIYGIFGYCPDCGIHNSLQILKVNFTIVEKMLTLAESTEKVIKQKLIENALEDVVSVIDGYGRELCKLFADKSSNPTKAINVSFQNIVGVQNMLVQLFSIDIAQAISPQEWEDLKRLFQKRHLLAHKMGVIDQSYIDQTGDNQDSIGRKIEINKQEVQNLIKYLLTMGQYFYQQLHLIK